MINMHFDEFISVLSVMYKLLMYVFPYHYSALMALHTVLHVDTVLVAVALMIMTLSGPSPGLGRHNVCHTLCSDQLRSRSPILIFVLERKTQSTLSSITHTHHHSSRCIVMCE